MTVFDCQQEIRIFDGSDQQKYCYLELENNKILNMLLLLFLFNLVLAFDHTLVYCLVANKIPTSLCPAHRSLLPYCQKKQSISRFSQASFEVNVSLAKSLALDKKRW